MNLAPAESKPMARHSDFAPGTCRGESRHPLLSPMCDQTISDLPSNRGFVAMLTAYRATGGTARGGDLARLLEDCRLGNVVSLATLIVSGKVFGFEWRHTFWVPMFQFELRDLSVKSGASLVLAELSPEFDGWALAAWFAQPNSWLNDDRPVDRLDAGLPAVMDAARADRFIAAG